VVWLLLAPLLIGVVFFVSKPLVEKLAKRFNFARHDA